MIRDNIKNANNYYTISERVKTGLKYLENTDFSNLPCGEYEIQGRDIYASIQDYNSKPRSEGKFEAHKKHIDIQYIIKGEEQVGVLDINHLKEESPYIEQKDIVFLTQKTQSRPEFVKIREKDFIILTPDDAHMPSISIDKSEYVKKVVVKVCL